MCPTCLLGPLTWLVAIFVALFNMIFGGAAAP